MPDPGQPRVHSLPQLRLTRAQETQGAGRMPVDHVHNGKQVTYWREPISRTATRWTEFRGLPLVLDGSGKPWAQACLWLLDKAQAKPMNISSLMPIAQDLAAYKAFLDDLGLEWDDFSSVIKYTRPTYIYRNHINGQIAAGEIKKSTGARRMSTVISFYRFLMRTQRMRFTPANPPWIDKDLFVDYVDDKGFKQSVTVTTTDISIKPTKEPNGSEIIIDDGGKLRPLTQVEQKALVSALKELGNIEYSLMHYTALFTGAREMTVLTLRVRDVFLPPDQVPQWPHKILCGPGTGIDTKRDVSGVYLSIPRMLYEILHAYTVSERAMRRRAKTERGESTSNYLFLTQHGQPYYESKEDRNAVRESSAPLRRSALSGRPLRKFIEGSVTPLVRRTIPNFKYRFHDLRATFGMNWVDYQMLRSEPERSGQNFLNARDQLKKLMWHKSTSTTDKYLEHRENVRYLQETQQGWNDHLVELIRTVK